MISDHTRRYWRYEYQVAERSLAPLLRRQGIDLSNITVLDVGCGEAGGLCALFDLGATCTGFDVDAGRTEAGRELAGGRSLTIVTGDVFAEPPPFAGRTFDLVVLHDVFEHLERKEETLRRLGRYLNDRGRMLISFPPYYSAFGGHQQHLPSRLCRLPYYHLFPGALGPLLPRYDPGAEPIVAEVRKLHRMKMGMRKFERCAGAAGMRVLHRHAYLLSPNFIRFGLPPVSAGPLARVPVLGELLCTGVVYILDNGFVPRQDSPYLAP